MCLLTVVDTIMSHKEVHPLIPKLVHMLLYMAKWILQMKLWLLLSWLSVEKSILDYPGGLNLIIQTFQSRGLSPAGSR